MTTKRKVASVAFTGAAAAAATAMAIPAAFAGSGKFFTHTSGSGGPAYSGNIKALTVGATTLTDNKTGTVLSCPGATVAGTIVKSGALGTVAAKTTTVFGTTANPCKLVGHPSITFTASAKANLSVSKVSGGVAHGHVVSITSAKIKGLCNASVSQPAGVSHHLAGSYNNANQSLNIPGTPKALHITKASGLCAGLINASDSASFKGRFAVSSPANGIYLTDPS